MDSSSYIVRIENSGYAVYIPQESL
jgi:hypothetical protein